MGLVMTVYAIDDEMRRRLTEPRRRGGLLRRVLSGSAGDGAEDLLADIEEHCDEWSPDRGDGKSWDVLHWALMGRGTDPDSADMFGADPIDDRDLAEWSGTLSGREVADLASGLERVGEDEMRRRLAHVPADLYWADTFGQEEEHDDVIADARELIAFLRGCADRDLGLLVTLN